AADLHVSLDDFLRPFGLRGRCWLCCTCRASAAFRTAFERSEETAGWSRFQRTEKALLRRGAAGRGRGSRVRDCTFDHRRLAGQPIRVRIRSQGRIARESYIEIAVLEFDLRTDLIGNPVGKIIAR